MVWPRRWLAIVLAAAVVAPASAQPAGGGAPAAVGDVRPWAVGVSAEDQEAARALFEEGNQHLREDRFLEADQRYREALALWSHPVIHYNRALGLLNLDAGPVVLEPELVAALAHGPAPFGPSGHAHVAQFLALVRRNLGTATLRLARGEVDVILDGVPVLGGPGTWTGRLAAGRHVVEMRAAGYLPATVPFVLAAGETRVIDLDQLRLDELTCADRPARRAATWIALGAGAAMVASGALLHLSASAGDDGDTHRSLGYGGLGIGGLSLTAGGLLLVQGRQACARPPPQAERVITVAPLASPSGAGLALSGRF